MEKRVSSANPRSRRTAEHYTWGEGCDGWRLVDSPRLAVIEERMPPGTCERLHLHSIAQQFFYVLSGEAVMLYEDKKMVLKSGEGMQIPPRVPHQIRNDSASDVTFLVISEPPTKNDREELTF